MVNENVPGADALEADIGPKALQVANGVDFGVVDGATGIAEGQKARAQDVLLESDGIVEERDMDFEFAKGFESKFKGIEGDSVDGVCEYGNCRLLRFKEREVIERKSEGGGLKKITIVHPVYSVVFYPVALSLPRVSSVSWDLSGSGTSFLGNGKKLRSPHFQTEGRYKDKELREVLWPEFQRICGVVNPLRVVSTFERGESY
ncbi:MAG: hypothetical protein WC651_00725 [Candidatus Gracilibacteria bacterium]